MTFGLDDQSFCVYYIDCKHGPITFDQMNQTRGEHFTY